MARLYVQGAFLNPYQLLLRIPMYTVRWRNGKTDTRGSFLTPNTYVDALREVHHCACKSCMCVTYHKESVNLTDTKPLNVFGVICYHISTYVSEISETHLKIMERYPIRHLMNERPTRTSFTLHTIKSLNLIRSA